MAAVDFPNSPTVGDLYVSGDITREWDGITWSVVPTTITGLTGSSGIVSVSSPITNTGSSTEAVIGLDPISNTNISASAAIDWTKLAVSSTVSSTELGYLDGVTSAVQTQLDAKALILVKSQTIGTATSSVVVTGVFSSTYDNYKIMISGGVGSTTLNLTMILGSTATGYYRNNVGMTYGSTTLTGGNDTNAVAWSRVGSATTTNIEMNLEITAPNLAKTTGISGLSSAHVTTGTTSFFGGFLNNSTQYTDFTLTTSTGTLTGGELRVYGYVK